MERRLHERTAVSFHVQVMMVMNPEVSASGDAIDISRTGMCVSVPLHFAPGSIVQLNIADAVLYGAVMYSQEWPQSPQTFFARDKLWTSEPELSGAADALRERLYFRTGIELDRVLLGTSGLSQLLKTFLVDAAMPDLQIA